MSETGGLLEAIHLPGFMHNVIVQVLSLSAARFTLPHLLANEIAVQHMQLANMHLPIHATSPQNPTPFTHIPAVSKSYTTTTPTEQDQLPPPASFATPTINIPNSKISRRIVWQTPNVVMDDIPTTLATVTTTVRATHWVTVPADSAATAASSLSTFATLQRTVTTASATTLARPLPEPAEIGLPDWPPLLTIFLGCWVAIAWSVALIVYLAAFPEKVAWLDRLLGTWKRDRQKNRHVCNEVEESHILNSVNRSRRRQRAAKKARNAKSSEQAIAALATGLGISFDEPPDAPRLRRPRSFDYGSLEIRDVKSYRDISATAPLPSRRSFIALSPVSSPTNSCAGSVNRRVDLESGEYGVKGCNGGPQESWEPAAGGVAGVLESVNVVIEFVARNLARLASDRVTDGAESDLLLPIREEDRARRP